MPMAWLNPTVAQYSKLLLFSLLPELLFNFEVKKLNIITG